MPDLLFLLGSPRSGKSTAQDVLCSTGKFAWISNLQNSYPRLDSISFFNRIYDIPKVGFILYQRKKEDGITAPTQSNDFWKVHLPSFEPNRGIDSNLVPPEGRTPPGLRDGSNISEKLKQNVKKFIENICKWQRKEHFISEYALWARMTFFSSIFPNPKFVNVVRDGRAVAYEYRKMIEKGVYPEREELDWWISGWPEEWREKFKENYGSLLTFCAYQWKFIQKMIWEDASNISKNKFKEVSYKDIVEKPKNTFSDILNFYNLEYNNRIEKYLEGIELENMNYKWRRELDKKEKEHLDQIIHEKEYLELLDQES